MQNGIEKKAPSARGRKQSLLCGEGARFGRLTCLKKTAPRMWRCRCKCGNEITLPEIMLLSGVSRSCGCQKAKCKNLCGQRFGFLTAQEPSLTRDKDGSVRWLCRCDCGEFTIVSSNKLRMGHTTSCGCRSTIAAREAKTFIDGTCVEIQLSRKISRNNTSGHRGVSRKRNGWQSYICYAGKQICLGSFPTIEEAVEAREKAEEKVRAHLCALLDSQNSVQTP